MAQSKRTRIQLSPDGGDHDGSSHEPSAPKRGKSTAEAGPAAPPPPTKKAKAPAVPPLVKKYNTAIAAVNKAYKKLERGYRDNPTPMHDVTTDECAAKMLDYLPVVKELMAMPPDEPKYAYCLLMYLGEHAHADLQWRAKQSG